MMDYSEDLTVTDLIMDYNDGTIESVFIKKYCMVKELRAKMDSGKAVRNERILLDALEDDTKLFACIQDLFVSTTEEFDALAYDIINMIEIKHPELPKSVIDMYYRKISPENMEEESRALQYINEIYNILIDEYR